MWVEKKFEEDPLTAVKIAMSSHATGQLVLHVSEGAVREVVWREKVTEPKVFLDKVSSTG